MVKLQVGKRYKNTYGDSVLIKSFLGIDEIYPYIGEAQDGHVYNYKENGTFDLCNPNSRENLVEELDEVVHTSGYLQTHVEYTGKPIGEVKSISTTDKDLKIEFSYEDHCKERDPYPAEIVQSVQEKLITLIKSTKNKTALEYLTTALLHVRYLEEQLDGNHFKGDNE